MAKYGGKDFSLTLEDAPGGTARTVKVTNEVALEIVSEMMETTPLGNQWRERGPVGLRDVSEIPLEGFFDDGANESHAVMQIATADAAPDSVGRQLVATVDGSALTFTVTGHLQSYRVRGNVGEYQRFSGTFVPSGSGVWSS